MDNMIIPIRCFSCGKVISQEYQSFKERYEQYKKSIALGEKPKETPKEILDIAVNSENESVVFYLTLKDLVPAKAGRDKVEAIIMEELSHITTLLKKLRSL